MDGSVSRSAFAVIPVVFSMALLVAPRAAAQTFGPQQLLSTTLDSPSDVHAADLDGDGDIDILCAAQWPREISWIENTGGGGFSSPHHIGTPILDPLDITSGDL